MSKRKSKPTHSRTTPPKPAAPGPATPRTVVDAIEAALIAVRELTAQRLEEKLSVARLMGVNRELRELVKVMSVYGA